MGRRHGPSLTGPHPRDLIRIGPEGARAHAGHQKRAHDKSAALRFGATLAGTFAKTFALTFALTLGLCLPAALLSSTSGQAQTLNDRIAGRKDGSKDRLLVQAKEMVYDADKEIVSAVGDAQVYYQGRVLEADRVLYDQKSKRVYAEGRVRMTEADGTVSHADRLELTDDFKTGFIDSLKMDTSDKTHMSAPRVERVEGDTVFDKGIYTACDACKDDPSKPPLWQVRAKRVIHKNDEQMLYYEEATLELYGQPIAYLPYFSAPDPSVKRKSGWLAPHYITKDKLGFGIAAPYFYVINPSADLTVIPTLTTKQGLLMDVEYRQRLVNGSYSIRTIGILQNSPDVFPAAPYGAGNRNFRGSMDTTGEFWLNEKWRFGWDVGFATDKFFSQDYTAPNPNLSANYFRERTSQVFLVGQADRGYFDLRGYYFQGLSAYDRQEQQPLVAPVLDYNKTFNVRPEATNGIGGQVELDMNLTAISRQQAVFESSTTQLRDATYGLYARCNDHAGGYNRTDCMLRGIAGEYTRASANATWKRQFIDGAGQVWTPFAFANLNGSWLSLDKTGVYYAGGSLIGRNADQMTFLGNNTDTFRGRALTGVGMEYRLPLIARSAGITHTIEPIAQVIFRPDEVTDRRLVNEDAQSLVFDDTNLFAINKYSGYDRFEGGMRANYGGQYTARFDNGTYANVMLGQSYQMTGRNSFANPDAANVGLGSGLDTKQSDYVARAAFSIDNYSFVAKTRLDPDDHHMRRLDLLATARFGSFTSSLQYARYEAQPLLGFDKRREGIVASGGYSFDKNYFATGTVIFDLSRHLNTTTNSNSPLFAVAGLGVGAGYRDECATLMVNFTSTYPQNTTAPTNRNQTIILQLVLRTLGQAKVSSSIANLVGSDGVSH